MGMNDRQVELIWEELVQLIEKGRVVPVVGQDLLVIEPSGAPPVLLYRHLANMVAPRLGLAPPPEGTPNPLNALACEFMRGTREQQELHKSLREAMAEVQQQGWIPEPLLQLAGISDFQLFVTTTIDPLLASALDRLRFADQRRTEVLAFSPYGADDLPPHSAVATPTVFHLLGRLQFASQYAVTEEDTLEFVHALQAESRRPARLFEELDRKHLLILGSGFSDWLARFFIRTAKSQRLWPSRQPSDFVADSAIARQQSLTEFLHHFSSSTRLFDMDVVAFVAELHHRWMERKKVVAVPETRTELPPMRRGAIFISYASEDRQAALNLAERLRHANLEVWFDRVELKPGDPWENRILLNISNASAFIPIISRHTVTRAQRFFRVEWEHAARIAVRFPADYKFIYPVRIDDTLPDHPAIPHELHGRQWSIAEQEEVEASLIDELVETYRSFQREAVAGA